jgi:radical SAM protein with 4Fe4S-binding SPASM domain
MNEGTQIGSLLGFAMARMASDETTRQPAPASRTVSLVRRRDAILAKRQNSKALQSFRAIRRRAGLDKHGPCVLCPLRRTCTSACSKFDEELQPCG